MRPLLSLQKSMLAVLVLLLALPGCILVVDDDDDDHDYFYGYDWRLDVIVYYGRTLTADDPYIISFEADGRLDGLADCNGYTGTFDLPREGTLSIHEIRSAGAYCGRQTMEDRYFEVLSGAVSYRIRDDDLIITSRKGDTLQFYKD